MTISNVMFVLNEAEFVEQAILSVYPGVDQLIVIDQGSTDGTRQILRRLELRIGISVIDTRGQNFLTRGEQFFRNLSKDLCFCDWFMVTDADEIMSDGWYKPVREFINSSASDDCGAIRLNYWQMVGSLDFHTSNSPLRPDSGERPLFYRMHKDLMFGPPMAGTMVHTSMLNIAPIRQHRIEEAHVFHLGYTKLDLTARYARNIERGDFERTEAGKLALLNRVVADPLSLLWKCVPSRIPKAMLPECMHVSKWKCEYDSVAQRITKRELK